uniref:Reverse transcriptase domain-containing protein n=1 Tax=Leptobrachium leishanense TaxID=445787 RepID=A0A8C5PM05_9ANUR
MPPELSPYAARDLQLQSHNVRGLNLPEKRSRLLRDLRAARVSVAFLQETHFRAGSSPTLGDVNYPMGFFSNFSHSKARGVAILISKEVPFVVDTTLTDEGGRYLFVRGSIFDTVYTFVSIYLPNKKQHSCLLRILRTLESFQQGTTIIAGDFNVALEPQVDSSVGRSAIPAHVLRSIRRTLHDHRLVDVWRASHPTDRDYSYFSQVHATYTRIDYFFMHYHNLHLTSSADMAPTTWSDHAPINLAVQSPLFVPRERHWRLNVSLLEDPLIRDELHDTLERFFTENSVTDTPIPTLWEAHKAVIRGFFICKSTTRKKLQVEERRTLVDSIRSLELEHIATNDTTVYQRLIRARQALDKLINASLRFQALRSRSFFALNENKPGRFLARILRDRRCKSYIPKIRTTEGTMVTAPKDISGEFLKFFSDLYNLEITEPSTTVLASIDSYLTRTVLQPLSSLDRETLNATITGEEILEAVKTTKSGKSPGPDGLPIEYYKTNAKDLLPTMAKLFDALQEGTLPHPHSLMATISLIPKPGKDHVNCSNYRPISLLNCDMKLLARVLANRLKRFLPQLIDPDQVGFIPGREARDATIRVINAITYTKHKERSLLLLSTDAEKAFDRVLWPFLFQTLKHYGIGENFLNWIRALYSTPSARVKVNGAFTAAFQIRNGTRQGCPLSPLLFALSLEPLLSSIRQNASITGVQGHSTMHKVSAYADDLMFLLPDPVKSMPAVIGELQEYGSLSGYKINVAKSEVLTIAPQKNWKRMLQGQYAFRWCPSSLTYLGIRLSSDYSKLFNLNFTPLFDTFKQDVAKWSPKFLSWMGRISVIKMNFLPRLLYLFHTIPIFIPLSFHKKIRTLFSSFIWPQTRPRLRYETLCKSKRNGGLALPDTCLYYYAAHLTRVLDWMTSSPEQKWLDLEEAHAGRPVGSLPWLSWAAIKRTAKVSSPAGSTLVVWHKLRIKYSLSTYPSPLLPLTDNPDFPVTILRTLSSRITDAPILRAHHMLKDSVFVNLETPDQPALTFAENFNLHQIRSFLRRLPGNASLTRPLTIFETLCNRTFPLAHSVSHLYSLLREINNDSPAFMSRWERTLDISLTDEDWTKILTLTHSGSQTTKLQESSYKLLTFWYRTPALLATFNVTISPTCWRCSTEIGTYIHIWWECAILKPFWTKVRDLIQSTTDESLDFTPQVFLLLHLPFSTKSMKKSLLLRILLVARSMIPLYWKSPTAPPLRTLIDRLEALRSNEELALSPAKAAQHFTTVWLHWSTFCSSTQLQGVLGGGDGQRAALDAGDA